MLLLLRGRYGVIAGELVKEAAGLDHGGGFGGVAVADGDRDFDSDPPAAIAGELDFRGAGVNGAVHHGPCLLVWLLHGQDQQGARGPEQEGAADAEAQRERPFLAGHSGGSAMSRACRMTMSIAWVLGLGMPCSCRTLSQYDSATRRALRISHEAARR